MKTWLIFGFCYTSAHNHFNLDRHPNSREILKEYRTDALAYTNTAGLS